MVEGYGEKMVSVHVSEPIVKGLPERKNKVSFGEIFIHILILPSMDKGCNSAEINKAIYVFF